MPLRTSSFLLCIALSAPNAMAASSDYRFDAETETCVNDSGEEGLNSLHPEVLFAGFSLPGRAITIVGRDAQCTDFSGFSFSKYMGSGYARLLNWDFRGSDFTGATLGFNFISAGLFAGSQLDDFEVAYGCAFAADISFTRGDMPCR